MLMPVICFSGCSTTTRFGDIFIPAHTSSHKTKDESIQVTIKSPESGTRSSTIVAAAVFPILADQLAQQISRELKSEAKKYKQQYSGKARKMLGDGTHTIKMIRSVGNVNLESEERLASSYTFEMKVHKANGKKSLCSIDLTEVTFKKSKAKIVSFNKTNPFSYVGALLLKTGDKVNVEIRVKLNGVSDKGAATFIDSAYPSGGLQFSLGKEKGDIKKGKQLGSLGDWFLMGRTEADETPMSIEITITESDPSNVQKILEDSSSKVNKDSILNLLPSS